MNIGGVFTISLFTAAVGGTAYLFWGDIRNWYENRHALRLLEEMAEKEAQADAMCEAIDHIRRIANEVRHDIETLEAELCVDYEAAAEMYTEFASTLEAIRDLDEIVGVEDV